MQKHICRSSYEDVHWGQDYLVQCTRHRPIGMEWRVSHRQAWRHESSLESCCCLRPKLHRGKAQPESNVWGELAARKVGPTCSWALYMLPRLFSKRAACGRYLSVVYAKLFVQKRSASNMLVRGHYTPWSTVEQGWSLSGCLFGARLACLVIGDCSDSNWNGNIKDSDA